MPTEFRLILALLLFMTGCQAVPPAAPAPPPLAVLPPAPLVTPPSQVGPVRLFRKQYTSGNDQPLPDVTVPSGASLRSGTIGFGQPVPPVGYGLYVYALPEREVSADMLAALLKFHACLNKPGSSESAGAVALFLVPTKHDDTGDHVDVQLAHDLLRVIPIPQLDKREVYFVASNKPLQLGGPTRGAVVIRLGRIAPGYLPGWLADLQDEIEGGKVAAPSGWMPTIKSAGLIVVSVGGLFGVASASAAETGCG